MKKILVMVSVVLMLVVTGCAIDPTLPDAMEGTMWENNVLLAGSRLYFEADGAASYQLMLVGDWGEKVSVTYTYNSVTRVGTLSESGVLTDKEYDYHYLDFIVSEDGKTLEHKGHTYTLKTAPLK